MRKRLRRFAASTPRHSLERTRGPAFHTDRLARDRAHRRQSKHPHRVGLPRIQNRAEQNEGRAAENQTQSQHLNQRSAYHDSFLPSRSSRWAREHRSCHDVVSADDSKKALIRWLKPPDAHLGACGRMRAGLCESRIGCETRKDSSSFCECSRCPHQFVRCRHFRVTAAAAPILFGPALDSCAPRGWTPPASRVILRIGVRQRAPHG